MNNTLWGYGRFCAFLTGLLLCQTIDLVLLNRDLWTIIPTAILVGINFLAWRSGVNTANDDLKQAAWEARMQALQEFRE